MTHEHLRAFAAQNPNVKVNWGQLLQLTQEELALLAQVVPVLANKPGAVAVLGLLQQYGPQEWAIIQQAIAAFQQGQQPAPAGK